MNKHLTNYILILLTLISTATFAQTSMKAPVRAKLKNGLTLIVAENVGSGKIYSRLTVENETGDAQQAYAQVLENYLNNKATQFNIRQSEASKMASQVTMSYNDVNTATNIFNFEQALAYVSQTFLSPTLAQEAYAALKLSNDAALLQKVTLSGLENYYSNHFKAADMYLTIAGDINPANAKNLVNRVLGEWKPANVAPSIAK